MFEDFTYERIMERLLSKVRDDVDKREGSIIWDALSPAASELEMAYIMLEYIVNQSFADLADRDFLILRARERGLVPDEATAAVIKGVFTPINLDVAGQRFSIGELNYVVSDPVPGEPGAYQMICETTGTAGNKAYGPMIPINYIPGLTSATATAILIPAKDEEDTESFRARYFNTFETKAFGGNVQDYIEKVSSLNGVGGVRVTPVWKGGRTVLCTIVDAQFNPASETLIRYVQEQIDPTQDGSGLGLAPIDHVVTINTPETVTINLNLPIEFDTGYTWGNMQATIREKLETYMLELRKTWKDGKTGTNTIVRVSQIETRLLDIPGILDVRDTTINGVAGNFSVTNNNLPVLGVITNAQG